MKQKSRLGSLLFVIILQGFIILSPRGALSPCGIGVRPHARNPLRTRLRHPVRTARHIVAPAAPVSGKPLLYRVRPEQHQSSAYYDDDLSRPQAEQIKLQCCSGLDTPQEDRSAESKKALNKTEI
jgi:hypothetical protein